jgi:hypothetical protein
MKYLAIALAAIALAGCSNDADVASRNLSQAADNFEVIRRINFINTWSNEHLLTIEGRCSLGNNDTTGRLSVTCKTEDGYKKHFLGLSPNVTFVVEHLTASQASTSRYRVTFKPSVIIPNIDLR